MAAANMQQILPFSPFEDPDSDAGKKAFGLYRKPSIEQLRVLRIRRTNCDSGSTVAPKFKGIVQSFYDKKAAEYETFLIHAEELKWSHTNNPGRMSYSEYREQSDAICKEAEIAAAEALKALESDRGLEEEIRDELLKGIPPQKWQHMTISQSVAIQLIEKTMRQKTFTIEGLAIKRNKSFKKDVVKYYRLALRLPPGSKTPPHGWVPGNTFIGSTDPNCLTVVLDQVSGTWFNVDFGGKDLRGAHLIPLALAGNDMKALCGLGDDTIDSPRNGLLMCRGLKNAFDVGDICFVPTSLDTPTQWKTIVVNQARMGDRFDEAVGDRPFRFSDVHDREVMFLNDSRPSKACCYFRFITAWLKASKNMREGIAKSHILKTVGFVTPTPLVDRSVLSAFALHVGNANDWEDLKVNEGSNHYNEVKDTQLARLQGARLAKISKLIFAEKIRILEERELFEHDDDEEEEEAEEEEEDVSGGRI